MACNEHLESDEDVASEPHSPLEWKGTGATEREGGREGGKRVVLP